MKDRENKAYRIALFGILGALALILSLFENIFLPDLPFLPAGAKPGLSNIITMFTASFAGLGGAIYITLIKAFFAFITRGTTAALMSLSGGILSTVALCIMIKYEGKNLSFIGIGIVCAVMHNMGQLACACIISGTAELINYGKYLLVFALVSGALTGLILNVVMPRLRQTVINHILQKH